MDGLTIVWIVVAVAVLVILVALLAGAAERQEPRAEDVRPAAKPVDERRVDERWGDENWADGSHPEDPRHPKHSARGPDGH